MKDFHRLPNVENRPNYSLSLIKSFCRCRKKHTKAFKLSPFFSSLHSRTQLKCSQWQMVRFFLSQRRPLTLLLKMKLQINFISHSLLRSDMIYFKSGCLSPAFNHRIWLEYFLFLNIYYFWISTTLRSDWCWSQISLSLLYWVIVGVTTACWNTFFFSASCSTLHASYIFRPQRLRLHTNHVFYTLTM